MSIVSSRYSEALFDIAVEENMVQIYYEQLLQVKQVFTSDEKFNEVLAHPKINTANKIEILQQVFSDFDKTIVNFLLVVIEKSRSRDVISMIDDFEVFYNEYNNILKATVYSVIKLSVEQIKTLEFQLSEKFSKSVIIDNVIDTSIIGGVRIVINNTVIDTSLKSKIKELDEQIHRIQLK